MWDEGKYELLDNLWKELSLSYLNTRSKSIATDALERLGRNISLGVSKISILEESINDLVFDALTNINTMLTNCPSYLHPKENILILYEKIYYISLAIEWLASIEMFSVYTNIWNSYFDDMKYKIKRLVDNSFVLNYEEFHTFELSK